MRYAFLVALCFMWHARDVFIPLYCMARATIDVRPCAGVFISTA